MKSPVNRQIISVKMLTSPVKESEKKTTEMINCSLFQICSHATVEMNSWEISPLIYQEAIEGKVR